MSLLDAAGSLTQVGEVYRADVGSHFGVASSAKPQAQAEDLFACKGAGCGLATASAKTDDVTAGIMLDAPLNLPVPGADCSYEHGGHCAKGSIPMPCTSNMTCHHAAYTCFVSPTSGC
eukprot:SAG31_NODE_1792_length_7256_cov_1.774626_4_plen_118_part_00